MCPSSFSIGCGSLVGAGVFGPDSVVFGAILAQILALFVVHGAFFVVVVVSGNVRIW
jgi:hypothetical protein